MSSTPVDVSIIIPAYEAGEELEACIDAVIAQDVGSRTFEVVLVDNGSEPPVVDRWDGAVRIVREPTPGSYAARNAGIAATTGRYVAFTDADCIPQPGWLAAGLEALSTHCAIATGPVVLFGGEPTTASELYEFRYGFPQERYVEEGFGVTANLFVTREAIETAGPFDASLKSGGDREFGQRLRRKGFTTVLIPDAVVHHPARRHVRELASKALRTASSSAVLTRRHHGTWAVLGEAALLLRPPLRAFWNILREERELSLRQRAALCGVVVIVRVTAGWARLRTVVGAAPPR